MLPRDDAIRLRHMLDAARDALAFADGRTRRDLGDDKQFSFAVVRAIEIIGEAASKVTPESQALLPGIPWPNIVGMRHRVVHGYYDVDLDEVWRTVTDDLPQLIAQLERALGAQA